MTQMKPQLRLTFGIMQLGRQNSDIFDSPARSLRRESLFVVMTKLKIKIETAHLKGLHSQVLLSQPLPLSCVLTSESTHYLTRVVILASRVFIRRGACKVPTGVKPLHRANQALVSI